MRRRERSNLDLQGTNIKIIKKATGKRYYYYTMPDGTLESLGQDRTAAIEAAHALNLHLRPSGDIAKRILSNQGKSRKKALDNVEKLIAEYREVILSKKNHTPKTLEGKEIRLEQYIREWGQRSCADISTSDIAKFLNPVSDSAYIKHRSLLNDLFGFAIHQGYRDTNPVAVTRTVTAPKKKRQRHTLDGYKAIYTIAPQWLKNAMDIALLSLQRRDDLTSLHKDQINLEKNTIEILQAKTRNYDRPVYIEIEMGEKLRTAIERCFSSGIKCPYLIHTRPKKMSQQIRDAKPHHFAVTNANLTKTFRKYRDQSKAYEHLEPEQRPTFHDIRALGIWLYEQNGFPDVYISALSGHATSSMLEHYKAGHEAQKPVRVAAELDV